MSDKNRFVQHEPCPNCGSKDNLARYEDGSAYCFGCHYFEGGDKEKTVVIKEKTVSNLFYTGRYDDLKFRGISKDVAKKFGVKVTDKNNYVYPLYNKQGEICATKIRKTDEKGFAITGDFSNATLFGQQLFGDGASKYLTITEGQDDALAVYQMTGKRWACVSVHSASSAVKDILSNIDFVESFENVVLCFDNDAAGKKAAQDVAEKLSPGKASIVSLSVFKDANEYLMNDRGADFQSDWWNKKTFSPVGVVSFSDAFKAYEEALEAKLYPLPKSMARLNDMLHGGIASGEITMVGAHTSIGKTTWVNNLLFNFLTETPDARVGYLGFETTVGEIVKSMVNLQDSAALKTKDSAHKAFEDISWKDRLYILDHLGALKLDDMMQKIRNMIVAFNLDVFIIDPVQAGLPDNSNEVVDDFMDRVLKLAKQTNTSFILVSHTKKPDDNNPHNISEYDLKGSGSLNQVSFNTILLSRDKLSDDERVKSTTHMKLVKCRRTGNTGQAGYLFYNKNTGRLEEGEDPMMFSDEEDVFA
jgi:twinkle protein